MLGLAVDPRAARRRTHRGFRCIAAVVLIVGFAASYVVTSATGQQASRDVPASALKTVAFVNPRVGYGMFEQRSPVRCEDVVAKTVDGGAQFTSPVRVTSFDCDGDAPVGALAFDAHGDGFLYGPRLYVTHDGGRSWARDAQPGQVLAVSAIGRSVWMVEDGCFTLPPEGGPQRCPLRVIESRDGGRTWAPAPSEPAGATLYGAAYDSLQSAYGQTWLVRVSRLAAYLLSTPYRTEASRGSAPLWYTDDGATSWTTRRIVCDKVGAQSPAFSVVLSQARDGTLVAVCSGEGSAGFEPKAVAVSTDDGRTWSERGPCTTALDSCSRNPLTFGYLGEVDAVSAGTADLIGMRSSLLVTHDGGVHWRKAGTIGSVNGPPDEVLFFDPEHGVVVGQANTATAQATIWHTSNGGRSWTAVTPRVS
jgi:photosystem II stability/assembly factor-like uncharacterized protein